MIAWEEPSFEELDMNAEIGAYQPDFGDDERRDEPLVGGCSSPELALQALAIKPVD